MPTVFEFTAGDTGSVLRVTCTNSDDDAAINLTGSTVELLWHRRSDGALQSPAMTIVTPLSGIASYQFAAGELEAPTMSFKVKITDSGGKYITSPNWTEVDVAGAPA